MLIHTFQHLPGIGKVKEKQLWKSGLTSWDLFDATEKRHHNLFRAEDSVQLGIEASRQALEQGNIPFFNAGLPKEEYYRILLSFPRQTLFLNIETTGSSRWYDHITLAGWEIDQTYGVGIRGKSSQAMVEAFSRAKAIVTFNGTIRDIPFLEKEFPDLSIPVCHVDLHYFVRRVHVFGGQEAVEKEFGIERDPKLQRVIGEASPVLWHKYCWGDLDALKLLIEYNHADIQGLKQILDAAAARRLAEDQVPVDPRLVPHFYSKEAVSSFSVWDNDKDLNITPYEGEPDAAITLPSLNVPDSFRVVGIDLTGSEKRPSGWSLLYGNTAETRRIGSDADLLKETLGANPSLVSIDGPLSLPEGRNTVDDRDITRNSHGILRRCERTLMRRGIHVYPCLIPSMQQLTARGIALAEKLRAQGIPVIESYPGGAQDILRIPRKRAGLEYLKRGLSHFGITGEFTQNAVSHDELDAITSALVGVFFWAGRFEALGDTIEDYLIIPDIINQPPQWGRRTVIGLSGSLSSGKTTAAKILQSVGFTDGRYSQIIREITLERGLDTTRENLQVVGQEIYTAKGQRWLSKRLLEAMPTDSNLVIDKLSHLEDHSFWLETFGPDFYPIHIEASSDVSRQRYLAAGFNEEEFNVALAHPVEANVPALKQKSHTVVCNESTLQAFREQILRLATGVQTSR